MGSGLRDRLRKLSDEFQMVQASADRVELLADMLSALAKPVPEYEPESRQTVGPLIFFERAASATR
jgi:hypothetical protein